ncbi:hypothetical protein ACP4OV_015465 [Aristida adscensionis]
MRIISRSTTMPPLPSARVLHASSLVVVLFLLAGAAASGAAHGGAMSAAGANATVAPRDDTEIYICYLCVLRHPLLIRYCPIYWDECHLVCFRDAADTAGSTAIAAAAAPAPAPAVLPRDDEGSGDECYVMKLYRNSSYVIVSIQDCREVDRCLLTCGGGDLADRGEALPGAAGTVPVPTAAAAAGVLPQPRLEDFQRCGSQVTARRAPGAGAGPGGVHRRL